MNVNKDGDEQCFREGNENREISRPKVVGGQETEGTQNPFRGIVTGVVGRLVPHRPVSRFEDDVTPLIRSPWRPHDRHPHPDPSQVVQISMKTELDSFSILGFSLNPSGSSFTHVLFTKLVRGCFTVDLL